MRQASDVTEHPQTSCALAAGRPQHEVVTPLEDLDRLNPEPTLGELTETADQPDGGLSASVLTGNRAPAGPVPHDVVTQQDLSELLNIASAHGRHRTAECLRLARHLSALRAH